MITYRKIIWRMVLCNTLGAFLIFFFFAYVDLETFQANIAFWRGSKADWFTFSVVMVVLNIISAVWAAGYGRSLARWEQQLQNGLPATQMPAHIQRRAASYPLLVAAISLGLWAVAGLFFAQGGLTVVSTTAAIFSRTFIGVAVVGGLTTATLIFLLADGLWREKLPIFIPSGLLKDTHAPRVSVQRRLTATFIITGFIPLVVLAITARNGVLNVMIPGVEPAEVLSRLGSTVLFIVAVGLVSNLFLSLLTTRSLLRPLNSLTTAMNQVAKGDLTPRVPVTTNDELGDLTFHFNDMLAKLGQSQRMRDLFGKYVSQEVAERVLSGGADLGGETVIATALFADIRDFTTLSERLPPQQVVDILNRYYTRMVDVIVAEGGMVNKFGGDSLLAIFGVPVRQPDHALRAVRAAWQMTRALAAFNAEQLALGLPSLTIGVGISSGEMVAGNIGGTERLEYTVIGDPVNLAARLESLTKEWGQTVLLSEDTERLIQPKSEAIQPCQQVRVKGKEKSTLVYKLQTRYTEAMVADAAVAELQPF
ncbi:Adenylate cyclase [hydrothermal vent metagenome]|uniref:Adenylate cyclase n=1 Tax=hydrothermal vent metagenome TaxID=652676 RepID=A0A3B0UU59_9ZZZZ